MKADRTTLTTLVLTGGVLLTSAVHVALGQSCIDPTYPEALNSSAAADVGSYPAGDTPTGMSDLAGNVFEWCGDWYGPYPTTPQDNPVGAETGEKRVARGGAYALEATASRSALRGTRPPDKPLPLIGFRVVRALTDEEKMFERLAEK